MNKNHLQDGDFFLVYLSCEGEWTDSDHQEFDRIYKECKNTVWEPIADFFSEDCSFVTNQKGLDWINAKFSRFPVEVSLATQKEVLEWQVKELFFAPPPYKPSLPYLKKLVDY